MPKQRTARAGADQATVSGMATPKGPNNEQAPGGVINEAKDKAQALANEAQDTMSEQLGAGMRTGKNRAAGVLDHVAQSLVYSSQQLRDQDEQGVSRYAERAAHRVERLADYLQNTSVDEMRDRVENFARREPAIFLGGAFALGLLGARFLKSSHREQTQRAEGSAYATTGAWPAQEASWSSGMPTEREVPRPTVPDDTAMRRGGATNPAVTGTTRSGAGAPGSTTGTVGEGASRQSLGKSERY